MAINLKSQVEMIVADSFNSRRITETLHYGIKLITEELGYLELSPKIAQSKIVDPLLSSIKLHYANLPKNRKYSDVKSLIIGMLSRPQFANDEFQAGVSKVISGTTIFFNKMAGNVTVGEKINNAKSVTARVDGTGPQVISSSGPAPIIINNPKPNIAPIKVSAPRGLQQDQAEALTANTPIPGLYEGNIEVNKSAFYGNAAAQMNIVRNEALDGDFENVASDRVKVSGQDLANFTSADGKSIDLDGLLEEKFPLLSWFFRSEGYTAEDILEKRPLQSSSSSSSMMTVPIKLFNNIMGQLDL